jgi:SAM-dependent methyltransferase
MLLLVVRSERAPGGEPGARIVHLSGSGDGVPFGDRPAATLSLASCDWRLERVWSSPTLRRMPPGLSPRLTAIVDALPLQPHSRVLEIGCGPGAAARALAARLVTGHILAIDRSASAIAQARVAAAEQIASGRMSVRCVAIEDFVLEADEEPYDIVFAVRVGALDGRHPKAGERALQRIAMATTIGARLFIDAGDPLRELPIPSIRPARPRARLGCR